MLNITDSTYTLLFYLKWFYGSRYINFQACLAETASWADSGQLQFWSEPSERSIFQTFWKLHCVTKSLFFELETSNFGCLLIFSFRWAVQIFSKIGQHWYHTFYKGPPLDIFWFFNLPKIQRGDPYKIFNINVVQTCWNFAQLSKMKK